MEFLKRVLGGKPKDLRAMDVATIEAIRHAGAQLERPRETRHYLYFATEDAAQRAATQLARPGRTIEVNPAATGRNWLALVVQEMVVDIDSITDARLEFERATATPGGDYDGWEAAVPEAAAPG